jgi:hypothetical protein
MTNMYNQGADRALSRSAWQHHRKAKAFTKKTVTKLTR